MLVLCGQPEQNQGWRSAVTTLTLIACSLAVMMASCALMRDATSASTPNFSKRCAMALAIKDGFKSAFARNNVLARGLGTDHSPPPSSASLNLPSTTGRTSERQLYNSSLSWYSMTWRFSSTTKISCSPVANSRVAWASSGHTTVTLCKRIPMRRQVSSSRPKSKSACRVSLYALPLAIKPKRSFGPCNTLWFKRLARM